MKIQDTQNFDSLISNSKQLLKLTSMLGYDLKKTNIKSKVNNLLENGVDLFYIDEENNLLLSSLLKSSLMSILNVENLMNSINEDKMCNLSPYWKNKICHDLFYSPFLEDLRKKGLTIEQQDSYEYMPSEIYSLKIGEDFFFKNFVYGNQEFDFEHIYRYKSGDADSTTSLRHECEKILELDRLCPEGNTISTNQMNLINDLNKYFFHNDLQKNIPLKNNKPLKSKI